ncbi:MAG: hypothetical protein RR911_06650 [Oscillospiraceae bacterium]
MGHNDDSDVKIFEIKHPDSDKDDIITIVEETSRQRQNGNSTKARKLGKELSVIATDDNFLDSFLSIYELAPEATEQVFALMQFSSEAALNFYLPSNILSTIAVNTLQEALIKRQNEIYNAALNGSSFSFYYLSVRKGGSDLPVDVGRAFAMLCGKENDEHYIKAGKQIYLKSLKLVEDKIKEFDFAND